MLKNNPTIKNAMIPLKSSTSLVVNHIVNLSISIVLCTINIKVIKISINFIFDVFNVKFLI